MSDAWADAVDAWKAGVRTPSVQVSKIEGQPIEPDFAWTMMNVRWSLRERAMTFAVHEGWIGPDAYVASFEVANDRRAR